MKLKTPSEKRPYDMNARAESTIATGEQILDATVELFWEMPIEQIPLDEIAGRAGVSVQTVIRRFGGKQGVVSAAVERESKRVVDQRATAPEGDTAVAIGVLIDHYDELGDLVIKILAEEDRSPALKEIVERGRRIHREWCARVFAPSLAGLSGADLERRRAQLVAMCDVYTWKLLRRDAGLNRRQTELALLELLNPIVKDC